MGVSEIKTPEITTISVEIKVLKIGKKQCTQAVFRQLPESSPNRADNLWGKVKYKDEWHVIFERNGTLMRGAMPTKYFMKQILNRVLISREAANLKSLNDSYAVPTYGSYMRLFKIVYDRDPNGEYRSIYAKVDGVKNLERAMEYLRTVDVALLEKFKGDIDAAVEESIIWNDFADKCETLDQLFIAV